MEQYSLAGPVIYFKLVWPDHFSARCDAPDIVYCWDTLEFSNGPILEYACSTIHSTLILLSISYTIISSGDTSYTDNEQEAFLCPHSVTHSLSYSCVIHSLIQNCDSFFVTWLFWFYWPIPPHKIGDLRSVCGLGGQEETSKGSTTRPIQLTQDPSWANWMSRTQLWTALLQGSFTTVMVML